MSDKTEITTYQSAPPPMSAREIRGQVNLIQEIMQEVMKKDEHYGVIPGTGGKPSLWKPGAEKLVMTFRLVPDADAEVIDLPNEHREYRVRVRISSQNGTFLGTGLGSCTTREGKYRYRGGEGKSTGKIVPKEYWDMRKKDPAKAQALLGGRGFVAMKDEAGAWMIAQRGERVEHDNPSDLYNVCLKMAKKRAMVDAVLTVTAASDIFTQDIEDMPSGDDHAPAPSAPKPQPTKAPPTIQSTAEAINNSLPDDALGMGQPPHASPEYKFATKQGGKILATGAEWIAEWAAAIERYRAADAMDKLPVFIGWNKGCLLDVQSFDPRAAAEVQEMINRATATASTDTDAEEEVAE